MKSIINIHNIFNTTSTESMKIFNEKFDYCESKYKLNVEIIIPCVWNWGELADFIYSAIYFIFNTTNYLINVISNLLCLIAI